MEQKTMNNYRVLAGILLFGSIWGMLECMLGEVSPDWFPMGAFLGGFIGLGLMLLTRRLYGAMWMQLGMAIVAGALRFWAPVGTCVVCSALAIMMEGMVFELIFNRPVFNVNGSPNMRDAKTLAFLGIISGFVIYTVGFMFTQVMTPVLTGAIFAPANFVNNLPNMVGSGFFAAAFGGTTLPLVVLAKRLYVNVAGVARGLYYATAAGVSVFCWALVFGFFYLV
jgi:hypothetical protein